MGDKSRLHVVRSEGPADITLETRRIPARGRAPALELVEARPVAESVGAPLLFVHGAFGGAWIWTEHYLPFLARRGRHAAALSLRAHGGSGGYGHRQGWSLTDFLDDIRRAADEMPRPPVIVGHSLGGLLAQMLIGRLSMRALVLLASLPPEGLFLEGPRLAVTDPHLWAEAYLGSVSGSPWPIEAAGYQVLFSEGLPRERIAKYASRMIPESPRALLEAHWPGPIVPASIAGVPTLVVGGEIDRLVWRAAAIRTAIYHGATYETAVGMGHFLQLDRGAEDIARRMLDWIEGLR